MTIVLVALDSAYTLFGLFSKVPNAFFPLTTEGSLGMTLCLHGLPGLPAIGVPKNYLLGKNGKMA